LEEFDLKGPEVTIEIEARALNGAVDMIVLPREQGMARIAEQLPAELLHNARPGMLKVPEDRVISRMKHLRSKGKRTIGIVMGARLEEERLRGNTSGLNRIGELQMYDPESLFGSPQLCVLSRWGMNWNSLPDTLRIAYQSKYERLAREYISGLVRGGYQLEAVPIDGCLGDHGKLEEFDLAIGVMCKGAVLESTRMWPLDRIWDEGPVLIGA
jgi:hypothetical protein